MRFELRFSLEDVLALGDMFKDVEYPEGCEPVIFHDTLLLNYGSMAVAYPVEQFNRAIVGWMRRKKPIFEKMFTSTTYEFNPIENYDRYEDLDTSEAGHYHNRGRANRTGSSTAHNINTQRSAGYETEVLKIDTSAEDNQNNSGNDETNTTSSGSDTRQVKHTNHIHGNIGVTTSSAMLEEYRRVQQYDVYEFMANQFALDLLVGVYF